VFFALCACILVRNYALYARHSGIPEIKTVLGGFIIKHFMGPWTLAIKSLGLVSRRNSTHYSNINKSQCLSVASGMWLGKEGPLVHVACCCASVIMKPFESLNGNEGRLLHSHMVPSLTHISSKKTRSALCGRCSGYFRGIRRAYRRCSIQLGGMRPRASFPGV
jgi:hypothetical protein